MQIGEEFRKYAIKDRGLNGLIVDSYMNNVTNMTRAVIEERPTNFREIDVFSRLIADRIIFLGSAIDDYLSNVVVAQLLFLESLDAKRDILMYINSPGGSVYAGLGIYDTMQWVRPDVATICTGLAASMGAVLLCAGQKGKRSALPHARVMIHQPMAGAGGQASDIEISVNEYKRLKVELYDIISNCTYGKKSSQEVEADADRDHWMSAKQAVEYGLIDEMLERKKEA